MALLEEEWETYRGQAVPDEFRCRSDVAVGTFP
jgi:hypothetical protein